MTEISTAAASRKKLLLIYNPASGQATFKKRLDKIIAIAQAKGAIIIPYRTERENPDLPDFIAAVQPDGILSAGGDGTLHNVVNVLLKNSIDLPVGIIGSGTSNDFATYLGLNNDLAAYFERIMADNIRYADIGEANGEYFVNVASAGMLTSVPHKVNIRLKNSLGKLAYYLSGLKEVPRFRPLALKVAANGQTYEENALFFVVINSDAVGSLRHVANGISIDDGKLDLLVVRWANLPELMKLTVALASGKGIGDNQNVIRITADKFFISAAETTESDLDGESGPLLPLTITTHKKAIRFFC